MVPPPPPILMIDRVIVLEEVLVVEVKSLLVIEAESDFNESNDSRGEDVV